MPVTHHVDPPCEECCGNDCDNCADDAPDAFQFTLSGVADRDTGEDCDGIDEYAPFNDWNTTFELPVEEDGGGDGICRWTLHDPLGIDPVMVNGSSYTTRIYIYEISDTPKYQLPLRCELWVDGVFFATLFAYNGEWEPAGEVPSPYLCNDEYELDKSGDSNQCIAEFGGIPATITITPVFN